MDEIDNSACGLLLKSKILCTGIIPINCALQPIYGRAKYSVADPDPYSENESGRVN